MSLRAVFFDFDGTLADSYPAIAASVNHVRARHGLPPLAEEEVRCHVGRGPAYLLEHTVPGCDVPQAVAQYRAHHPSVMCAGTYLLPAVRETLQRLHERGILLGVCSNKPRLFTEKLLEHLGVARLFSAVLGPEDVPNLKPAPDMLLAGLSRLKVKAEEALYVGDMVVDIETGRAAGVTVWAIPTGSDSHDVLRAAQPARLLKSCQEILEQLV